jgi:hypothetical protein
VGKIVLQFPNALEAHPQPQHEEDNAVTAAAGAAGAAASDAPSTEDLEATIAQLRQTILRMQIDAAAAAGEASGF